MVSIGDIKPRLDSSGQAHLYKFWDEISLNSKKQLLDELKSVPCESLASYLSASDQGQLLDDCLMCPDPSITGHAASLRISHPEVYKVYGEIGMNVIANGQLAVILLAGGQGTRLGSSAPKGMYDIGLPSGRSLYQLQAERLLSLSRKASKLSEKPVFIPWYIMTSEHTKQSTERYFQRNGYFGYDCRYVIFFDQFTIPTLDYNGKILMRTKASICVSPEGNGGIYRALRDRGILKDMETRGVKYVHIYGVDNVLIRMADPVFLGFCITKEAECGVKVVEKMEPDEPIGVVGVVDGKFRVVEYSEISQSAAKQLLPVPTFRISCNNFTEMSAYSSEADGDAPRGQPRLLHCLGNICNHFMNFAFLERVCSPDCILPYHIARKKVTYLDPATGIQVEPTQANAFKLEKFIFDVFPFASKFAIWEVPRSEEFAPLKNGPTAETDCPSSCRAAILDLHTKWAIDAGAQFPPVDVADNFVEISPLVSLTGEGLECLKGQLISGAMRLELRSDAGLHLGPILLSSGQKL